MVEVEFYIPTHQGSTGELHPSTAILDLHRFLDELKGWTIHGVVRGSWKNPETGEMEREESFHYSVAVSSSDLELLRSFLGGRAKSLFDQKAIYFKVSGSVELL